MGSRRKAGDRAPWAGGFVRWDKRGVPTYWIERRYAGKRWCFSLKVHELDSALSALRSWEQDPFGFRVGGATSGQPLRFDAGLRDEFLAWSETAKRNSYEWIKKQRELLYWWSESLDGRDLRRLSLTEDILPALDKIGTRRAHRIAVLKALYGWLRKVRHALTPAEDPTMGTLSVPQSRPEQWKRPKAFTLAQLERVRAALTDDLWRACVDVQAGTGWHATELVRFARAGEITGDVLICPQTKAGSPLRTRVSSDVATSAGVVRSAGALSYWAYWHALADACERAGLKRGTVSPGNFRHSVATAAIEAGDAPESVSAFLNHRSAQTTKRFYATLAVPPKIKTLK